ncbi:MAG: lipoprotein [Aeromicrobium sp.]|nr:lipoprotein [Burkholderiales bacterium]
MSLRRILRILSLATLVAALTACGQKGPLRLPDPPKSTAISGSF